MTADSILVEVGGGGEVSPDEDQRPQVQFSAGWEVGPVLYM